MADDLVTQQEGANQPGVSDKGQGGNKDAYVPLTREQAESLARERDESRESERYWAGLARGGNQGTQVAAPTVQLPDQSEFADPDEAPLSGLDDDTPEKLVNDFAATGTAALQKRGFITAADALKLAREVAIKVSHEMIGRNQVRSAADQKIVDEFADLKVPTSALFKATAPIYREAIAMDPNAANSPATLFMAAKAAKAQLAAEAKRAAPADDDTDGEGETAEERRQRIDSQDGSRTRGRTDGTVDDMLGSQAREIIAGFGVSEAEYKQHREPAPARRGKR